jgi:hypothetical protein
MVPVVALAGTVAVPIQTAPLRTTSTTSLTLQVRRAQPPQLLAQVTIASLPSKAVNDGAGLVDQPPTVHSLPSAHKSLGIC